MRTMSYDPDDRTASLVIGEADCGDTVRVDATPWLTAILSGERLVGIEVRDALDHIDVNALIDEPLVGTAEAAEMLGIKPPNFVRESRRDGFPRPAMGLSSKRVWHKSDIVEYCARRSRRFSGGGTITADKHDPARRVFNDASAAISRVAVSEEARQWLPEMTARIARRFHPDKIVLFGSQARGEARPDSDVDLLVVMPSLPGGKLDIEIAIRQAVNHAPVAKDIIACTAAEADAMSGVPGAILRNAINDGVTLYDRSRTV
jgi:predicted DNA-binding transcriptional regulator AlpA